jgi:hypothetical protein
VDASGRLLNRNSIASLETIRSLLLSKDVAISDLQFLIDKDGRFVIADPGGLMHGSDRVGLIEQGLNIQKIDNLIREARRNLARRPN